MTLNLKAGVDPSNLQPEILLAIMVAHSVYVEHGFDCVVTRLYDFTPSQKANSLHNRDGICRAVDLRINHVPDELVPNICASIRLRLTTDYDVIQERDHLHLEYDPKPKQKMEAA